MIRTIYNIITFPYVKPYRQVWFDKDPKILCSPEGFITLKYSHRILSLSTFSSGKKGQAQRQIRANLEQSFEFIAELMSNRYVELYLKYSDKWLESHTNDFQKSLMTFTQFRSSNSIVNTFLSFLHWQKMDIGHFRSLRKFSAVASECYFTLRSRHIKK